MSSEENPTRRGALQKLVLLPVGAAVIVLGAAGFAFFTHKEPTPLNIKIQYVGMSFVIQPDSETLKVQSPAKLSDLETTLWKLHPALQTMEGMQVWINGTSIEGNPDLKEGDEVDFVALMAGG